MTKIYTVGHSTRSPNEFLAIIAAFGIELLIDVRTIPRSRRNPQYEQASLRQLLAEHGVAYIHMPELGGLRRPRKDSLNDGWENASFRGYADYMQTGEFASAIDKLVTEASGKPTVIMCAEAVPWRCHRSLIADALLVRGIEVTDILSERGSKAHTLTPWARVDGQQITYPKRQQ